ncbi:MAG: DUF938 domain-containing protein [Rickettsiales bacterium]|jgi:trans-aconitate methyltransferase|nr:DUF938 domain-containing protein [Rickettsiales bacterium]
MTKPYSASCERNWRPIADILKKLVQNKPQILFEVGSGTGQHAVYITPYFPKLTWITSDLLSNHDGIKEWLDEAKTTNIRGPVEYEIGKNDFPCKQCDLVFTANSFHIMSWKNVEELIQSSSKRLGNKALFVVYGPFKYGGTYTSQSNADFDQRLYKRDSNSAIRNFEDVQHHMKTHGLSLFNDFKMPTNNQMLVFQKDS